MPGGVQDKNLVGMSAIQISAALAGAYLRDLYQGDMSVTRKTATEEATQTNTAGTR
jgi:hypothetical protein